MTTTARKPTGPYRSRSGLILGVCKGLGEYLEIPVFWCRFLAVFLMLFTGFWPMLGLYLLAAVLLRPEPVMPLRSESEAEFYNSYAASRKAAVHRLKRTFDALDRRLQRLEHHVTSREYDWQQRLRA